MDVNNLKEHDQDFEFYPSTDEMLNAVEGHLFGKMGYFSNYGSTKNIHITFNDNNKVLIIPDLIDIGAGDGRVLDYFKKDKIVVENKYGIEKSDIHADNLIKRGVSVIGRDFFQTTLIDKAFSVIYSNPPYSRFKEWTAKILTEGRATFIYLTIPERWEDDSELKDLIYSKGEVEILGNFDFLFGDRKSRAKVNVISIFNPQHKKQDDPFDKWIETNIGTFDKEIKFDHTEEQTKEVKTFSKDSVAELIANYQYELDEITTAYIALAKIPIHLLNRVGVNKDVVLKSIKTDIEGLKRKIAGADSS